MPNVSDELPELFHYTTVDAFENIYKEQKFRATHYEDLTDSSELKQFRLKVLEFIHPILWVIFEKEMQSDAQFSKQVNSGGGIKIVVDQEAAKHLDRLHKNTFGKRGHHETFICSFCNHAKTTYEASHGLLSQWRGYAAGNGVAIVLDTKSIEGKMRLEQAIFAHPLNHIGDIKYDDDDEGIKKEFCDVFENFPKILHALASGRGDDLAAGYEKIYDHFASGSTLVKHHGFREEKEVRIVVSLYPTNPDLIFYGSSPPKAFKEIKYRARGDSEVRYIELFGNGKNDKLPIARIIVGPSRFQNVNYQKIRELVKNPKILVEMSMTPFLG